MRALIVEDDRPTSALLRAMLEGESCLVEVAYDGEEAMARLGKSRYDLILLDISLPKRLSGADILQHLSLHDPDQLTRVIVVTGMDVSEIRKLFPTICHAFGKPVIPSRVLSYVRSCIGIGGPDVRNR